LKHPPSLPNSPQQHEPIRTFATKSINETKDDPTSSNTIQGTIPFHGKGLKMGQYAEVHRKFTQDDVNLFGRLSGDMNPVHFPPTTTPETTIQQDSSSSSSSSSQHTQPIVHGILLSSLFSNIFGTLIPGAIYRHQSLKFHNFVHVNEDIVGRVVVTKLRQIHRKGRGSNNGGGGGGGGVLCTCDTSVIKMGDVTQKLESAAAATTKDNNNRDGKEEIVCISGDAQVWLPDLQLVYECREKGE
jgi:acyl dehydratase